MKELVSVNTIDCPNLQEICTIGADVYSTVPGESRMAQRIKFQGQALIHSFRDGTTSILCNKLADGKCSESKKACNYSVDNVSEPTAA